MSKGNQKGVRLTQADVDYLDGLFDPFDDLEDDAWQAACEGAVRESPRFKGRDPYDVWISWVQVTTSERGV